MMTQHVENIRELEIMTACISKLVKIKAYGSRNDDDLALTNYSLFLNRFFGSKSLRHVSAFSGAVAAYSHPCSHKPGARSASGYTNPFFVF